MKPVFIVGFMGAGKSTFGKKLAAKTGLKFVDLDTEVLEYVNRRYSLDSNTLSDAISAVGFDVFRLAERDVLRASERFDSIVATGGGTPCFFSNMDWMLQHGTVIFLNTPRDIIYGRLRSSDRSKRPLVKDLNDEQLRHFVTDKLAERLPFYQRAGIIFNPQMNTIDELLQLLNSTK